MSPQESRKRPANEPVEVLVARDHPAQRTPTSRPLSTTLGSLFVFGRGLAGLAWLGVFALIWPEIAVEEHIALEDRPLMFWVVIIAGGTAALISLTLAWSIRRGSNLARVLVMCGVTISTLTAAISYFSNGEKITIDTTLLTVSLDILVLLALSSRDARQWARQSKRAKRKIRARLQA